MVRTQNFVTRLTYSSFLAVLSAITFSVGEARSASLIEETTLKTEINLLLQSVVIKNDFLLLGSQLPFDPSAVLEYTSITDDQGWTGTLTGSYSGLPINVNYTGTLSGNPEVTVNGDGTIGTEIWSSEADAEVDIGDEDPVTRTVGVEINPFNQTLGISGTVSNGIVSASISALKDFDGDDRRDEGFFRIEAGVSVLEVGPLGSLAEAGYNFDLFQESLDYEDGVETSTFFGLWETRTVVSSGTFSTPVILDPDTGLPVGNIPVTNMTTFQPAPVPESSLVPSLFLLSISGVSLTLLRKQNKEKSAEKKTFETA